MSTAWKMLEASLEEAVDPVEKLVRHIEIRYGSHQADELRNWIASNPAGDLQAHVRTTYVDPEVDALAAKVAAARNPKPPEPKKKSSGKKKDQEDDREPRTVDPAQARSQAAQTAATAASRPDRSGVKANVDRPTGGGGQHDTKAPDFQAMGTAGQNQAQPQPSLSGGRSTTVAQRLRQLQALIDDDPKHPQRDRILKAIDSLQSRADDEELPAHGAVPKTPETRKLERINALLRNDEALNQHAIKFVKANPSVKFADAKATIVKKLRAKAQELGNVGSSTIRKTQQMDPDKFFRQGGSRVDADDTDTGVRWDKDKRVFLKGEPEDTGDTPGSAQRKGGTVKPQFAGKFPGQLWMPNAFSRPDKPEDPKNPQRGELGFDPELDAARAGGFARKGVEFGDKATGGMGKAVVPQNPAVPRAVKVGRERWADTHGLIWAGEKAGKVANPSEPMPQAGWVTKSQFAALVAQGLIRRKDASPSNPDLSKARSVAPVNPPSSRANLDNTTGRPTKPRK